MTLVLEYSRCAYGSCVCFFFFKQKTAYEMRISDWSSDVCSSDLAMTNHERHCWSRHCGNDRKKRTDIAVARRFQTPLVQLLRAAVSRIDPAAVQIGRASCRERVCQYV